ncbi:MAG: DUF4395 domain-containing protein [Candidatus Moraniibacteriota bacterium]
MTYGKIIPGLMIDGVPAPYGVVNEREVRAAAGIMFALGFFALLSVYFEKNITLAFWVVLTYWVDFLLKVGLGPEWSLYGRLGALLVRNQRPEYVGAVQKRFAWGIGLVMSSAVLFLIGKQLYFVAACNSSTLSGTSPCLIPMILCSLCLVFMWLETALGFCVGCTIYTWLVRKGFIKPTQYAPACPGGVCAVKR